MWLILALISHHMAHSLVHERLSNSETDLLRRVPTA